VPDPDLLQAFRFRVTLLRSGPGTAAGGGFTVTASVSFGVGADDSRLGDGGFAECSGLDLEMDVQELQEGGRNDGVIRRVGRGRYQNIVLKRGMLGPRGGAINAELWRWLQDVLAGVRPVRRYDGVVEVMGISGGVAARWAFTRGLPAKLTGPQLQAQSGAIAVEELHIAHEGLRLVTP
jgi:phage tail-like protein